MSKSYLVAATAASLLVIGCSSGGDSNATTSTGSTPSTTTAGAAPATTGATTGGATTGSTAASSATGYQAVQAIFTGNCAGCHGDNNPKGGYSLTSYDNAMKPGKDGPMIKAGDAEGSGMVQYLEGKKKPQMPFGKAPLSDADQKTIKDWINGGAKNA